MRLFLTLAELGQSHRVGLHVRLHLELGAGTANLGEVASESA